MIGYESTHQHQCIQKPLSRYHCKTIALQSTYPTWAQHSYAYTSMRIGTTLCPTNPQKCWNYCITNACYHIWVWSYACLWIPTQNTEFSAFVEHIYQEEAQITQFFKVSHSLNAFNTNKTTWFWRTGSYCTRDRQTAMMTDPWTDWSLYPGTTCPQSFPHTVLVHFNFQLTFIMVAKCISHLLCRQKLLFNG